MKPTREEFQAYVLIQMSGVTNMFDTERVQALVREGTDIELSQDTILYIMGHYNELSREYRFSA